MAQVLKTVSSPTSDNPVTRRDFLYISTASIAATGSGLVAWPFIDNLNPSSDVLAISKIEIALGAIELGQRVTVKWRGKPVFIVRRTPKQIALARVDDGNQDLIDPATDASRVSQPEWLIIVGVCTHLGCIPLGQKSTDQHGKWGGWFCPCHGSVYDLSGRVRHGPAPKNLVVPPYQINDKGIVLIG